MSAAPSVGPGGTRPLGRAGTTRGSRRHTAATAVLALVAAVLLAAVLPLRADEGMWTFDNPPLERLQRDYGFTPSAAWLERLRLSSVRFNDGGSGAFVSPDGLMVTNHHVGLNCIQNLSTHDRDLVANGFVAPSRESEPACPGYEVNVLVSFEDVSSRVIGAAGKDRSDQEAREARKGAIADVESACASSSGLRCEVVTLYQGGEYHLYRYRTYTDVRLVFAPEQQIAFFGGDADNFTYPRYDLDVALFRAYEAGRPARPPAHLRLATGGAREGDLVFVSGHPGYTSRLDTMAQLVSERDVYLPASLRHVRRRLSVVQAFAARSPENARRTRASIFGLENTVKGLQGRLDALEDEAPMRRKADAERELRDTIAADPDLSASVGEAWGAIAAAQARFDALEPELRYVGFGGSRLLWIAGHVVRLADETEKPNTSRLTEYTEANLPSLLNRLYSGAPIYLDVEEVTLRDQLEAALEVLGPDHALVRSVLAGRTPAETARAALAQTRLQDPEARRALVKGGADALASSNDSMIVFAKAIDPPARAVRRIKEDEVEAVITRAGERLAPARWKAYGKTVPPDATFTLRLSYGVVKGYSVGATRVPAWTTFHGLYDRSTAFAGRFPWSLPPRFVQRKHALELTTPLNFVSTNDIIGGNSGSPVVSRTGEVVGFVFDGNMQSMGWEFFYTEEQGRAVSVDVRAVLEALRKVYDGEHLLRELLR